LVREEWRKIYNMELNHFYCSTNIIRVIKSGRVRWAGHVARMWESRGKCMVLIGNPALGRHRGRWENDSKVDI
jgi:hypothetical protein